LMHFFLIRMPAMDSFWHLHPQRMPDGTFVENLPTIPPGHYQMFADVVLGSGFPMTMLGQIDVPDLPDRPLSGDDSGTLANPLPASADEAVQSSTTCALAGGGQMIWERDPGPVRANVPFIFRFRVEDDHGQPASDIQPYMGMAAHAAVVSADASVFAHIHPSGSASMAALEIAQANLPNGAQSSDSGMAGMPGMPMPASTTKFGPEISFPYGFPKPGLYRIFVQIRRGGQIQTGIFEADVQ